MDILSVEHINEIRRVAAMNTTYIYKDNGVIKGTNTFRKDVQCFVRGGWLNFLMVEIKDKYHILKLAEDHRGEM